MSTYSQIYLQIVFAVYGRNNFIKPYFEDELYKYVSGIITQKGQKSLAVNGMPDHIHLAIGLRPSMRISDLVKDIKIGATNFINDQNWLSQKFCWQDGYGVFSYSRSNFGNMIDYVCDQKQHHAKFSFKDEYHGLLKKFNIPFQEKYMFEFYD